jgi:hypothetical protein
VVKVIFEDCVYVQNNFLRDMEGVAFTRKYFKVLSNPQGT